jgi:hypothetical protein
MLERSFFADFFHYMMMTVEENDLHDMSDLIRKGALVAGNPNDFESISELSEEEKAALRMEHTNKWKQTKTMYALVICCSMAAVVQGWVLDSSMRPDAFPPI